MSAGREQAGGEGGAVHPVILSASRATDLPAFYSDWFMNRLRAGFFRWRNPFRPSQTQTVYTDRVRAIVFWSKHPAGLWGHLAELDRRGVHYEVQYTLNDYEAEGLEPGLPPLAERIDLFRRLADRLGPERVIWRLDPLVWTDRCGTAELVAKAGRLARGLAGHARQWVFSFVDLERYAGARRNLARAGIAAREPTPGEMEAVAERLGALGRAHGFAVSTCAEPVDLSRFGIVHGRCVDGERMRRLRPEDAELAAFLASRAGRRDRGQRPACGCAASKDIGQYRTCPHLCAYCYASGTPGTVRRNHAAHHPEGPWLVPDSIRAPEAVRSPSRLRRSPELPEPKG